MGRRRRACTASTTASLVFSGLDLGNVLVAIQPPRGLRRRPGRRVPLAQPAARPPLPRVLPLARRGLGRRRRSSTSASTARSSGCRARRSRSSAGCWPDAALGDVPFFYPFVVNDPGRGHAGQAARPRGGHRPPAAAHDPGRHLRRDGPARAALRRVRPAAVARPVQAAGPARPDLGAAHRRGDRPRPRPRRRARTTTASTTCSSTSTATSASSRTRRSAAASTPSAPCPRATRSSTWCSPSPASPTGSVPSLRGRGRGRARPRPRRPARTSTRSRPRAATLVEGRRGPRLGAVRRRIRARRRVRVGRATGWCRSSRGPTTRSPTSLPASTAATCPPGRAARSPAAARTCCRPAGTSTRSTQGAAHRAVAGRSGASSPTQLLARHLDEEGDLPRHRRPRALGHGRHAHPGRRRRRGARAARRPAGVGARVAPGRRARADPARRSSAGPASTSRCASPASSATRSRTWSSCSTTRSRLAGVARRAARPRTTSGPHGADDPRVYGPGPGAYGVGHPPAPRAAELALRRRPRRRLHHLVRATLRPRRASACRPRTRCGAASPPSTWR